MKIPKVYNPEHHDKPLWGHEEYLYNGENHCGKFLHFKKYHGFSWQYHKKKEETWILISGRVQARLSWSDDMEKSVIRVLESPNKDCLHIPVELRHQVIAYEPSVLLEISTHHENDDTYQLWEGGEFTPFEKRGIITFPYKPDHLM